MDYLKKLVNLLGRAHKTEGRIESAYYGNGKFYTLVAERGAVNVYNGLDNSLLFSKKVK